MDPVTSDSVASDGQRAPAVVAVVVSDFSLDEEDCRPKKKHAAATGGPWSVVDYTHSPPDVMVHNKYYPSKQEAEAALAKLAYGALYWAADTHGLHVWDLEGGDVDGVTLESVSKLLDAKYPKPAIDWWALLPASVQLHLVPGGFEVSETWGAFLHDGIDFMWDTRHSGSKFELDCSQPLLTPPAAPHCFTCVCNK